MGSSEERVVAVIMVGGLTKGTRFRPLSLNILKPLFPLAGQPMVHHPISVCRRIPNLVQIFLIGLYEEKEFALYVSSISNELIIPIRYLREDKPHGSAGGLYSFRDYIMEDEPVQRIIPGSQNKKDSSQSRILAAKINELVGMIRRLALALVWDLGFIAANCASLSV